MTNNEKGVCSRILTPKQVGPICWFMATFVAMFYSQRSRKILIEASKNWNKYNELFILLKHVLDDKYLKVESRDSKDYEKFSDNTFRKILILLNRADRYKFPYNPRYVSGGFYPKYYIGKLYNLLNVDYKMYEYNQTNNELFYSYMNEDFNNVEYNIIDRAIKINVNENKAFKYNNIEANIQPPQILMVIVDNANTGYYKYMFPHTMVNEGDIKDNLTSMKDKIFYKGIEYNLDSVILANWNLRVNHGHAIAGITCKKKRYVYNGWTRTSMDPLLANIEITRNIPCELMPYDWNIRNGNTFCLNTKKCTPDIMKKIDNKKLCFDFSTGQRILIYVRKNLERDTSVEQTDHISPKKLKKSKILKVTVNKSNNKSPKLPKKCPEGKVLNPATGRCILIKNTKAAINKLPKSLKSPKKCPDGKVLNPATGRCILIKNKK